MVAAAKLPVLNPNEFKLWKMRIEQSVDGVKIPYPPTTVEKKLARKNELKARAIEKSFGGNKESKKVHNTLLKQQYENFNGTSSEGLDQIYDRLQKLISQFEIHKETISQEDLNMELLRSLPSEWKTHTLIWHGEGTYGIRVVEVLKHVLELS
uniref:Uncharacterized protein n=1 Tax=Tanacetum cinerariifolium TaxID=118510 RepID=A0A6L2KHX7_TANCI|nr:hypothetical protein [Tanacetum cinerariifolium]